MSEQKYGLVIHEDGRLEVKEYAEPLYKTLGQTVRGWIEVVQIQRLPERYLMIVNEEGLLLSMDSNPIAGWLYAGGYIAGPAVILQRVWTEDGPDIGLLTEEDVDDVKARLYFMTGAWEVSVNE